MKIEIAKEGRMDMSGRGLMRAIQNNNMPLLDLLVRESIQNSLDAFNNNEKFVQVEFEVSDFHNYDLAQELEGIENTLKSKYGDNRCRFLSIKDTGTVGLTGPLHFSERNESGNKNLLNLVYEVAKPQEGKDAGGSWGYGKTVYFRMGIGLVIYYSRIKQDSGIYQSRLAACLVEDEKKEDALLRSAELNSHRGLAWWGQSYLFDSGNGAEEGTIPETDESKIIEFLSNFGIKPFKEEETGTTIIIPYIDEKKLLTNNITAEEDKIPWASSVTEYIRVAVQRWYPGRLNNPAYLEKHRRPWLRAVVNNEGITDNDMAKVFKEIRRLYNMALSRHESIGDYKCEEIKIRDYFESTTAGYVAYKMFSPDEMEMNPPYNNPSPFVFVKNEDGTDDYKDGDIILTYFRKPGMAIEYDTSKDWVNKIKCHNEKSGDILIAVFVLNSDNKFKKTKITDLENIEEYFRASEKADHTSWYDINVNDKNPKLLSKIQHHVKNKINDTYKKVEESSEISSSSLSKMFGDILLPKTGFGNKASNISRSNGTKDQKTKHKSISFTIRKKNISRNSCSINLPVAVSIDKPVDNAVFSLAVAADGKNIPLLNWRDKTGTEVPFSIQKVSIRQIVTDSKTIAQNLELNSDSSGCYDKSCSIIFQKNTQGDNCGITIKSEYKNLKIEADFIISIKDAKAQMAYQIKEE